ncbi:MAG: Hsp20/alpha crystallin family protein [Lachnospiraceae bacterium]|nr:Hsp20/alpha crystallin family protein [Lachnospiraceae bacterium]
MLVPSFFKDDYFDDFFNGGLRENVKPLMRTDIREIGEDYLLEIEMPGFSKDEIHAELEKGYLTISGVHVAKIDEDERQGKYIRRERNLGKCSRTFYIGENLKQEDVKAKYENGILTVAFPKNKKPEVEEKRTIAID